ncbi:hypothetical protein E4S40_11810 [Algoriphagus kandeliae]|uniref:Uncharacterized protein n=1 Tax=Algoriphagus kandeliae TaxID=2562278 RepID=A0A4Y9QR12_9BACT|nr:hypothetical protein [Algoriphagus kandeliae]TFV94687.1 hypothetical protein E4S40_11810 [Algoriphagus kandeliae]
MKKTLFLFVSLIAFGSCNSVKVPTTLGDSSNASSFGYHPVDPLPVWVENLGQKTIDYSTLLGAMPDETIRLAIAEVTNEGVLNFGTSSIGVAHHNYVVILDYIKYSTDFFRVEYRNEDGTDFSVLPRYEKSEIENSYDPIIRSVNEGDAVVPVYVGVGLRLTASITVNKNGVDLGNLFSIGAQASSNKIAGTLTVQTLGISGDNISSIIPMPSEINPTTIQNAILAMGTIKAKLYDDQTVITPRVVGVYNYLGGSSRTINKFVSSMLIERPKLTVY